MPRNADAEARLNAVNRRVGEWLTAVSEGRGCEGVEGGAVTDIRIRLASRENPEVLLIVKAEAAGGRYIGFVGGLDAVQALLTWRAKDAGKGLKWRVDVPWGER